MTVLKCVRGLGVALLAVVIAAILAVPLEIAAQRSTRIAFVSERDGNEEIYSMNPDGTGLVRLTSHPEFDNSPALSPDGAKIAFVSGREVRTVTPYPGAIPLRTSTTRIYMMNADGTMVVAVGPPQGIAPAFSSDGRKVAFLNNPEFRGFDVFIMGVDGSNMTRLTRGYPANPLTPASFSPDGRKIAFACSGLCVMNADGTDLTKIPMPPTVSGGIFYSAFSPDGRKIAFGSWAGSASASDVFVVNLDSGDVIRLTDHPASDNAPAFSPDGGQLAFVSYRDGNAEIYVMNADGTGVKRLTNHLASDYGPTWR